MKHKNNAYSVLNGSITNVATAITLATGTGSRFPTDNFKVTLIGYDGNGNENAWEICLCTSRTGDILTVQRGQEGTTAVAWANATRIENRVTADTLDNTLEPTITAGTTSQYWRGDKTWRDFFTDVRAATLTGLSTATNAVITATDTVLSALGKLQKQVSDNLTTLTTHTGNTSNPHSTTAAQVGAVALTGNETVAGIKTFSSTITGSISGNAGTATTLQTARTINGTSFNGSANIVVDPQVDSDDTTNASHYLVFVASSTAGYQRLKEDSSLSYNPSTNTLTVANLAGNASSATTAADCSGNAATATALETARTINGTSFNGSANITTANWGTSRTITIGSTGKAVNGSANVSWTLAEIGALPLAGGSLSGDLGFSGTGLRITGDFSNATSDNRVIFQSSTANGFTDLSVVPNGTGSRGSFSAFNAASTTNAEFFSFLALATESRIWSGAQGTGTTNPITVMLNSTERARWSVAGGYSVGTTADPGAGGIYATGNITAYYSDKRLKDVTGKIENALDKVSKLSGVYYTSNDVAASFGYTDKAMQVGVLAQEVEAVLPEIVKPAPFDLDEHGNSKSGENYMTVQYERLVPLLIEAIKELNAKVKELEAR